MDLMGQLGELLGQYSGANGNEAPADVEQHFDQIAQNVRLLEHEYFPQVIEKWVLGETIS